MRDRSRYTSSWTNRAVSQWLVEQRKQAQLSQKELVAIVNGIDTIGFEISVQTLSAWETGNRTVPAAGLLAVAAGLRVELSGLPTQAPVSTEQKVEELEAEVERLKRIVEELSPDEGDSSSSRVNSRRPKRRESRS